MKTLAQFFARLAERVRRELRRRNRGREPMEEIRVYGVECPRCRRRFPTGAEYAVHRCGSVQ